MSWLSEVQNQTDEYSVHFVKNHAALALTLPTLFRSFGVTS
jgi:hypothetical protein